MQRICYWLVGESNGNGYAAFGRNLSLCFDNNLLPQVLDTQICSTHAWEGEQDDGRSGTSGQP